MKELKREVKRLKYLIKSLDCTINNILELKKGYFVKDLILLNKIQERYIKQLKLLKLVTPCVN